MGLVAGGREAAAGLSTPLLTGSHLGPKITSLGRALAWPARGLPRGVLRLLKPAPSLG